MEPQTAVVLGATGLIGSHLVELLLNDNSFNKVRVLVRRPVEEQHPKLEVSVVDFGDLVEYRSKLGKGECIFCCIGTTQSKVKGDKTAYRKIDYDIPVNAARIGKEAGFKKYLLVSSVGASDKSSNFYLKVKGEVESSISDLGYDSFHVFRPSILLGDRKEFRLGELVGKRVMRALSFIMVGSLKKYKGIEAGDVAQAMVAAAKTDRRGIEIYEYDEMKRLL
ncbi:MAG: Semialdehyde dehydrogenase - binding protein [Segetibacter sp.]|nr:Semialdehyde dehydrogenase - binding protein [Segetibacter sp.]